MTVPISVHDLSQSQSVQFAQVEFPSVPVHVIGLLDVWWNIGCQLSNERVVCECGVIDGDDFRQVGACGWESLVRHGS